MLSYIKILSSAVTKSYIIQAYNHVEILSLQQYGEFYKEKFLHYSVSTHTPTTLQQMLWKIESEIDFI